MPVFLLIRHAENDYVKKGRLACRLPGVHLNETGRAQSQALAAALAPRFKDTPPTAIYCSPMERAIETIEPLAQIIGLPVTIRPRLVETDCGQWAGRTVKSLSRLKAWKVVQHTPSQFQFPGGESFVAIQQRFVAELNELRQIHTPPPVEAEPGDPKSNDKRKADQWVLCVSHADPIKLAVAYYLGMPLDFFQRLVISPASVSVLHLDEKGARLFALNVEPSLTLPKP